MLDKISFAGIANPLSVDFSDPIWDKDGAKGLINTLKI